jgi:hypothetical protein
MTTVPSGGYSNPYERSLTIGKIILIAIEAPHSKMITQEVE